MALPETCGICPFQRFAISYCTSVAVRLSESLTPTLVQYEMAKRWNGQMPQVSGSAMPMIQLPGAAKP